MTRLKTPALLAASLMITGAAFAEPLTVTVDGIEARGGKLYVGVQTEAQFMKNEGVAGQILDAPAAGTFSATFDLPVGRYAVAVWHDIDANGVFDVDENGIPVDGWSSPRAESLRAAPTFDEASVDVAEGGTTVSMQMIYPQ